MRGCIYGNIQFLLKKYACFWYLQVLWLHIKRKKKDVLVEDISIIHQQFFADNTFSCEYLICTLIAFSRVGREEGLEVDFQRYEVCLVVSKWTTS